MIKWIISDELFVYLNADMKKYSDGSIKDHGLISGYEAFEEVLFARFLEMVYDCPNCGGTNITAMENAKYQCKNNSCRNQFSETAGTYISNCKMDYEKIWRFAWLVGDMKIISSCIIARDLEVTQHTAYKLVDALRRARKETTNKRFLNGSHVLQFKDRQEVLKTLLSIKPKTI
jgi:hypothetical protein